MIEQIVVGVIVAGFSVWLGFVHGRINNLYDRIDKMNGKLNDSAIAQAELRVQITNILESVRRSEAAQQRLQMQFEQNQKEVREKFENLIKIFVKGTFERRGETS